MLRDASADSVSRAAARLVEVPIRAEFFGAERLEAHAESLAREIWVAPGGSRDVDLLRRLDETVWRPRTTTSSRRSRQQTPVSAAQPTGPGF
ncbi:MAG: hypothetical protein ACI9AD_001492 [Nitriliruptoraceae bacterium]|jgi:hypothetical protein